MRCAFLFVLALSILYAAGCTGGGDPSIGRAAPDFQIESINEPGKIVKLSDYKGKVVLLDFWATWCGPCRELAPTIDAMNTKYGAKGLQILAISDEDRSTVEQYKKEEGHGYPLFLDQLNNANNAYPGGYIPRLYVIDRQGKVAYAENDSTTDPAAEAEAAIQKSL